MIIFKDVKYNSYNDPVVGRRKIFGHEIESVIFDKFGVVGRNSKNELKILASVLMIESATQYECRLALNVSANGKSMESNSVKFSSTPINALKMCLNELIVTDSSEFITWNMTSELNSSNIRDFAAKYIGKFAGFVFLVDKKDELRITTALLGDVDSQEVFLEGASNGSV